MSRRLGLDGVLLVVAAALALGLVLVEIPRIIFPWDLLMFSETSFLTDMMKISAGQSTYTSPTDCNSFIYAPGLDYLTYGLLRPFGAELDIRACRLVSVLIGVAAAIAAGRIGARFGAILRDDARVDPAAHVIASTLAAGIIFKSYTADACHPDNLHVLHAMIVIALTFATLTSSRYELALLTIAVAALGMLVKQTAGLGIAGSGAVLLYLCGRRWGRLRSALLVAWGAAWVAVAAYVILHGWGRYWTTTLVSEQPLEWWRRYGLVQNYTAQTPYRTLLIMAFPPSALYVAMRARRNEMLRKLSIAWLAIGVTEALPSLIAYFKMWGFWNNLTLIDTWMGGPVFGALWLALRRSDDEKATVRRALAGGLIALFLVSLLPTRTWPMHDHYEFGRALDAAVARDTQDGKRVLVSGSVASLVHAGVREPPLDRTGSLGELVTAGRADLSGTKMRVADRYYRKIYELDGQQYPGDVQQIIHANYHEIGHMPGAAYPPADWDHMSVIPLMQGGIRVFEANP